MGRKTVGSYPQNKSLSRSIKPNFEVEQMEQRLLLSANLYDAGAASGDTAAKDAIKTQIVEVFDRLGGLGDAINSDAGLNSVLNETKIPLLDQTLSDITGENLGDFFNFGDGAASIESYFNAAAPTSGGLRLRIQDLITAAPGLNGMVTDFSTAGSLDLMIDLSSALTPGALTDIDLAEAAEEFNLNLSEDAEVNLKKSRNLSFRIQADLSNYSSLGDDQFWVDVANDAEFHAEATHTSTLDTLSGFGLQVGILGMRDTPAGAGAYVFEGEYLLDVTAFLDLGDGAGADNRFTLSELKSFGGGATPWGDAYSFRTPATASTNTVVGQNTGSMTLQLRVANPTGTSTEISSIGGVAEEIRFLDVDLFDNRAPLVSTSDTLAAFGRLSPDDLLNMVDATTGWAAAIGVSDIYQDRLPFLNLTTGDAYAFGEAFREVFYNQLETAEQILTAVNAPSTQRGGAADPLDYTGRTSFIISVNGAAWTTVTLAADASRDTLVKLATALNAQLPAGVFARATDTASPRLQLQSVAETAFALSGFEVPANGVLDLGFNTHAEVLLTNSGNLGTYDGSDPTTNPEAKYQLPEIEFQSTTSINLASFTETRSFTVNLNGEGPVTITIPAFNYTEINALAERIQEALASASLYDSSTGDGLVVKVFSEGGVEGLRFYTTPEVFSLELAGADIGLLGLVAGLQSSEWIDFQLNGNAAETFRLFISGNLTGDILDYYANQRINDLSEDIKVALQKSTWLLNGAGDPTTLRPLLDEATGTGLDIRSETGSDGEFSGALQFFARNPGTGSGDISSFAIVAQSAGITHLGFDAAFRQSRSFAASSIFTTPNFSTVQEFASRIAQATIPLRDPGTAGIPFYDPVAKGFVFPIAFTYTPPALTGVDAVAIDLDEEYGEISSLTSGSEVDVTRTTTSSFNFQFNLIPDKAAPEDLSVDIPVQIFEWDGRLALDDAVFTVILDDGAEHDLRVNAASTLGNIQTSDFVAQLQAELVTNHPALNGIIQVELQTDAEDGRETIVFSTVPALADVPRMFQVRVRQEVTSPQTVANAAVADLQFASGITNFTSVSDVLLADAPATSVSLNSHALFKFSLFDGNVGTVLLESSETTGDIVADLNLAIEQNIGLSTAFTGKILAFIDDTDPLLPVLAFKLNPEVFPLDGTYVTEDWSVEVFSDYTQFVGNGASSELGIRENNVATSNRDVPLSIVSGAFEGSDPFRLTQPAVFDVSINGSDYVSVTVPAITGAQNPTMGDLIAAINGALAVPDVTISRLPNPPVYKLSDFLEAVTFGDGSRLAIISKDNSGDPTKPSVLTFRMAPDLDVANNEALTTLGFLEDEQRIGGRGGELFLESIRLTGTAEVTNQDLTATGRFGIAEFESSQGSLNLLASTTTSFRDGGNEKFSYQELVSLLSTDETSTIATTGVELPTFVTLTLEGLSFVAPDVGTAISGLEFGAGAIITFSHALTSDSALSSITDFANLPAPELTYLNTGGIEKLFTLGFEDILGGLMRTAEFISDQMTIVPPNGALENPFSEKLLFVKQGLVDIYNFGDELSSQLDGLESAPPSTLQGVQEALGKILLPGGTTDLSAISLTLEKEYDMVSGDLIDLKLDISLPFAREFSQLLPLFIDLRQLRDRSKNPALVGGTNGYLEGIDSLTSDDLDSAGVNVSGTATLALDLGIEVVRSSVSVQPRAILYDTTDIDMDFNLTSKDGGLTVDLAVGSSHLRLTNGTVAINGTATPDSQAPPAEYSINLNSDQTLPYEVLAATTSALDAVYTTPNVGNAVGATLEATNNGWLNSVPGQLEDNSPISGIDGVGFLEINDLILVKDQSGLNSYQNGIYRIKSLGSTVAKWELVRVEFADAVGTTNPGEFSELRVAVKLGTENVGKRFIQSNDSLATLTAGAQVNFVSDLERVYSSFSPASPTIATRSTTITTEGQARAVLPLVIVVKDDSGRETFITKDTSRLTEADKANPAIVDALPAFPPLDIRILNDAISGRSGLSSFFNPAVSEASVFYTTADTEAFTEMPAISRNLPPTDVLKILRNPFLMGDALDLSLFNLQFAIDQALGREIPLLGVELPTHTDFVEAWRSQFTRLLRDSLRLDPLRPINAILDSLFNVLGPNNFEYLTDRNADILVETLDVNGMATAWNPNQTLAPANYGLNSANQTFEVVPDLAVGIQFSLNLRKELDTFAEAINIDRIDLNSSETGLEVDTATVRLNDDFTTTATSGGVNLRRSFDLHLGFGVDLANGFFLFNPNPNGSGEPMATISIEAALDGDLATVGVQQFNQTNRTSQLHQLDIVIGDAWDVPVISSAALEPREPASGFYGDYHFYLNTGSDSANPGRMTLSDIQSLESLGYDQNAALPAGAVASDVAFGIFSDDLDGDADIHLLIEGGKDGTSFGSSGGGIPTIQTEFWMQKRYGSGSRVLSYQGMTATAAAAANAVNFGSPTSLQQYTFDHVPESRYNRGSLGNSASVNFTNITLDAEGFLKGTIFEALLKFSDGIRPLRPVIDFLLTPVPGTEWMAQPLVPGDLLGRKFLIFAQALTSVDNMIRSIGDGLTSGLEAKPRWAKPRVMLGAAGNVAFGIVQYDAAGKKKTANEKYVLERDFNRLSNDLDRRLRESERKRNNPITALTGTGPETSRETAQRLKDAFNEKVYTQSSYATRFEQFRDEGFARNEKDGKVKGWAKKKINSALDRSNDRAGSKSPIIGITGGGIRLDYLKIESIHKILQGQTANLTFLELPRLELGVAYSRSFPLPAFPPLVLTVGASLSINANFKFGWDTESFYWSTLNTQGQATPAFGFTVRLSVGVALNFGLIEVGIEAFIEVQVDFNWNDVTVDIAASTILTSLNPVDSNSFPYPPSFGNPGSPDYGKLRGPQMDYLKTLDGGTDNLFDITLTARVGLTLYVDLVLPIPFVGPITIRIVEKTFAIDIWQRTWFGEKPTIQLASQSGNTLNLNMGPLANLRLFSNTIARNEVFTLISHGAGSSTGEKVEVRAKLGNVDYTSVIFDNITLVTGTTGAGKSEIDASALTLALVNLRGGNGNTTLRASQAGTSGNNRNRLTGGSGTNLLVGATARSTILVAGTGSTTIIGGTASDDITSGISLDILKGGGGGDRYIFNDGFGRDRITAIGRGNIADFSGITKDMEVDLGRLVQSAKQGKNTMFFAPDGGGANSIDTWITGSGNDRFFITNFPPSGALNTAVSINGGAGNNFYSVTLGNPLQRFYSDTNPGASTEFARMDPRNIGRISITDPTGNGHTLLKQTFPESIFYDRTFANNVREQLTMSGMRRVDLDAGNSPVIWGAPGIQWVDLGEDSVITAGSIQMVSNAEADGLTLNLRVGFDVSKILNLRNDSNITINLENVDPGGTTSMRLGPAGGGIFSSSDGVFNILTDQIDVPSTQAIYVGGIPSSVFYYFNPFPQISAGLNSTSFAVVPALAAVSVAPANMANGQPSFTVRGRNAVTIPGRASFAVGGLTYATVADFVVPAVPDFVSPGGGSQAFTIPAVAAVTIPAVPGPGGRSAITIPGRAAVTVAALPVTIANSSTPGDVVIPANADGAGFGTIRINAETGGIENSPDGDGVIQALNGNVIIDVRDTIGFSTSPLKINAGTIAAITRKPISNGSQGINIVSDEDVTITSIDGINGLTSVSGRISVTVAPGKKIIYGNIFAGEGRDIVLEADEIELATTRQVVRKTLGTYYEDVPTTRTYYQWIYNTAPLGPFGSYSYYSFEPRTYTVNVRTARFGETDTFVTLPGGGNISTTGRVLLRNVTDDLDLMIGSTTLTAGSLSITRELLNSIDANASTIVIGRTKEESVQSGHATVYNKAFSSDVSLLVQASQITIPGTGVDSVLSSGSTLEFQAYEGSGDGTIRFLNGGSGTVIAPTIKATAFRGITVDSTLTSNAANGAIELTAGFGASTTGGANNTGSLTVTGNGLVTATNPGSSVVLRSGTGSGNIQIDRSVSGALGISLEALGGSITVDSAARLIGDRLTSVSRDTSTLRTDVRQITSARVVGSTPATAQNLFINELNDIDLIFLETGADAGLIDVVAGGSIYIGKIDATLGNNVTLDAQGGSITSNVVVTNDFNVRGDVLTATAAGEILFDTKVNELNLDATALGEITVNNTAGEAVPLLITMARTANGKIDIGTDSDLTARLVESLTSSVGNSISLTTRELFGGHIIVDIVDAGAAGDVYLEAGSFTANPVTGLPTSGGTITSDSGTTNRVVARELVAYARGYPAYPLTFGIDLRTNVEDLVARTFTGGNVLELDSRVDIRIDELDDIRLRRVQTFSGDIIVTTPGTMTHQAVRSPGRDIYLTSTGGDIVNDDTPVVIDGETLPPKIFGRNLEANAPGVLTLNTAVDSLIAESSVAGDVTITETDSVRLERVTSNDGDIAITAGEFANGSIVTGGNAELGEIQADAAGTGNVTLTAYGQAITSGQPGTPLFDPNFTPFANAKINASLLEVSTYGRMDLLTNVDELIGQNFSIGNVLIQEDDALDITRLISNRGLIDVTAGGTIDATLVQSETDLDQGAFTFNISLRATAGDVLIDEIIAGRLHNDIFLTSDVGKIEETGAGDAGIDLQGDRVVLNARSSIGGDSELETEINSLEAHAGTIGNIAIQELNGVVLTDVDTNDGSILVDADGDITAVDVESTTDSLFNTITLRNTSGDILLGKVIAQRALSDVFLTSDAGSIDSMTPLDEEIDLQGNRAVLTAFSAIGGRQTIDTELNFLTANVLDSGDIGLHEASSITLEEVTTADGNITVRAEVNAFVDNLETKTDAAGNNVFLSAGGDLFLNRVISGSESFTGLNPAGATTISADADRILEWKSDPGVDLRARNLNLEATRNIGTLSDPLETSARQINSVSGLGSNALNNYATGPVLVTNLQSTVGSIFFEQFSGTITLNNIAAGTGNITLFHNGSDNMIIGNVSTGAGNLRITVRDTGRLQIFNTSVIGDAFLQANELDFLGGFGSVFGTGTLFVQTDTPQNGLVVSPYKLLEDTVRLLEYDITRDRADGFSFTFFLGNVLFFMPIVEATSGGGASSGSSVTVPSPEQPIFIFSDLINSANEDASETGFPPGPASQAVIGALGYSPIGLVGLSSSPLDNVFSGLLRVNGIDGFFSAYFGYYPIGLESLYPDLFDELTQLLEEEPEETKEIRVDGPQVSIPADENSSSDNQIVVSRGEALELETVWSTAESESTAESRSAKVSGHALAVVMAGLSGRFRKNRK